MYMKKQIIFAIFASWDIALQLESMIIPYTIAYYAPRTDRSSQKLEWNFYQDVRTAMNGLEIDLSTATFPPSTWDSEQMLISYFDPIIVILEYAHLIWAPVF